MRNKLFLLFIACLVLSCENKTESNPRTILEGKVENPMSDNIGVLLFEDFITRDHSKQSVAIDDSGRFKLILSLQSPQKIFLSRPRSNNLIFLYPGDSLFLTFDDEHLNKMIHFEGINASHNEFLNIFKSKYDMGNYFNKMRDLSPEEFKELIIINRADGLLFFNDFDSKNDLRKEFRQFALAQINYQFYSTLFMYVNMQKQMHNFGVDSISLPKDYYDFIAEDDFNNDAALINVDDYLTAVGYYVRYKLGPSDSYETYLAEAYNFAKTGLKGKTREYFQAKQISHMVERTGSVDSELIDEFLLSCQTSTVKEVVTTLYKKHLSIISLKGSYLPDHILFSTVFDQSGEKFTFGEMIDSHKDKLIFLDIWSLGCRPCLDEMPHSKKLMQKYKDEDITFIFLSTDEMLDMWKQGIEISKIDHGHYQLQGGHQSELLNGLNIKAIPRYILIDREGRIIDLDANRPSSDELTKELDDLLSV